MNRICLSIVVPVYNEEENIMYLYEKLMVECEKINKDYEIIFVDDGSHDNTVNILCNIQSTDPLVKIIKLSRNYGHQIALSAGLDHSAGDYTLTMDADIQHPPELIPKFLEKAVEEDCDIVTGVKEFTAERGMLKNLLATFYYWIFEKITKVHVEPNASDFRLYSRKAVDVIKGMREKERYLRGIAEWIGFSHGKISYVSPARHAGTPKYTIAKLAKLASLGIFSFSAFPVRVSTFIGISIIVFNVFFIVLTIILKIVRPELSPGYPTIIIAILFLFSWLFIVLGVIGEYIYRIYEEVKERPLYVVDWKK
jgi:glycosyltransferase involved in cell wall biosynthesis